MLETVMYSIGLFISFVLFLFSLLIGASLMSMIAVKVPFVPTPRKKVKLIIDQLDIKPGQTFYDLGCGDGRFLIEAENAGAKAIGFEVSPWAYVRAKTNILLSRSKAKVFYKNFYFQDIADADRVYCFLLDKVMPRVEKKLQKELKSGAKVACLGFKMPTWKPEQVLDIRPEDKKSSKIYLYVKK